MQEAMFNPYAPPQSSLLGHEDSLDPESLPPVPFEDHENIPGFWSRVGKTFALAFSNPMEFFIRVPVTSGLVATWRFALLLSTPFLLIMMLVVAAFVFMVFNQTTSHSSAFPPLGMTVLFGGGMVLSPLFVFIGILILGLLNHFLLWVWGGLRHGESLEQTCRAVGYTLAFTQLVGWVPILGPFAQLGVLVVLGMGLARMHHTETWRGVCAVFTPVLLCCACYLSFFLIGLSGAFFRR